jgi:putative transposase
MRKIKATMGEYYHVFNRGVHKQTIFNNDSERYRFLFLITHLQSERSFADISEETKRFRNSLRQHRVLTPNSDIEEIISSKVVELLAFILMPNHFHLILKELKDEGIASVMQRMQNSFTKYMNIKNETSGHLFAGPYRIVHIKDNEQLLYTSAYTHLNCRELISWAGKESEYPWSSYPDYVEQNRWGKLLSTETILEQFDSPKEYRNWVETSGAKGKMSTLGVDIGT